MVTTSTLTTGIGWDDISGRYRDMRTGRFIPQQTVADALQATIDAQGKAVANLTQQFRTGAVTLAEWRAGMAQSVKTTHLASSALANGGWAQMTQADYGRVGQIVREQYAFLDARAAKIASGEQRFDGTLEQRAKMYVDAGRHSYESAARAEDRLRGYDEEINIPGSDGCEPHDGRAGCAELSAQGWVPIGTLPLPGTRACLTNCLCHIERRRSEAA